MFLSSRTKRTMGWWRSWPAGCPSGRWCGEDSETGIWTGQSGCPQAELWRERGMRYRASMEEVCAGNDCGRSLWVFLWKIRLQHFPTEWLLQRNQILLLASITRGSLHFRRREILRPRVWKRRGRRPVLQEKHCGVFTAFHLCEVMEALRKGLSQCFPLIQHDLGLLSLVHLTCTLEASSPEQQCKAWAGLHLRVVVKRAVDVKTRCPRFESSLSGKLGQVRLTSLNFSFLIWKMRVLKRTNRSTVRVKLSGEIV